MGKDGDRRTSKGRGERRDRRESQRRRRAGLAERWHEQTAGVLEEMRRQIRVSGASQREVEERAGFSKGYLTKVLGRTVDLKLWHVLAFLDAVGADPRDFFSRALPGQRRRFPALERFRTASRPLSEDTDELLGRLYGGGVESLNELRDRLSRCEKAISELEEKGLLDGRRRSNGREES